MYYQLDPADRFFFFFQAEDGIRDIGVTGVQTCALPIFHTSPTRKRGRPSLARRAGIAATTQQLTVCAKTLPFDDAQRAVLRTHLAVAERSEERRVGKECRSRWTPHQEKKKTEDKIEKC